MVFCRGGGGGGVGGGGGGGDEQIINVFLVTTIAGTLLDTVSEIVEEPTKTFTLLGEALPKVREAAARAQEKRGRIEDETVQICVGPAQCFNLILCAPCEIRYYPEQT